jgi:methionyl-tRNA formyltransferase
VRLVFAGTPEFAVPALTALAREHELAGVLTQPDRPRGRGRQLTPSAVKQAALERGLPLLQPASLREETTLAALRGWRPDALVVVAYGLLLPPILLALPPYGCINLHASLLPRWRGAAPIQRAILAGDELTGVTIMQTEAGLDTGPILLQQSLPMPRAATSGELHATLALLGAAALCEALRGLAAGQLVPQPQPAWGATYAPKIDKSDVAIDWSRAALSIERQVRALHPRPGAESRLAAEPLRILAAEARDAPPEHTSSPGTVLTVSTDAIVVACGGGQLAVKTLQRPNRNVVSAREFAQAYRVASGLPLSAGRP